MGAAMQHELHPMIDGEGACRLRQHHEVMAPFVQSHPDLRVMNADDVTGGGAGMALAHCIVHGHPPMDLHEAAPKRFPSCFNSAAALADRVPEVLGKHYEITYPARQWTTGRGLRPTPLDGRWRAEKAHFGQVHGFERPLYFGKEEEPVPTFGKPDWFGDRIVGKTTSAAFGYRVGKPVALATIDSQRLAEAPEQRVDIDIAGSRVAGAVTFEAAFDPRGARMRPVP